jgi:hypothetical protein
MKRLLNLSRHGRSELFVSTGPNSRGSPARLASISAKQHAAARHKRANLKKAGHIRYYITPKEGVEERATRWASIFKGKLRRWSKTDSTSHFVNFLDYVSLHSPPHQYLRCLTHSI